MYMEDRQTKDVKTLVQMMTVMMEVMTRVKAQMTGLRGAGGWRRHAACSQDWLEGCPRGSHMDVQVYRSLCTPRREV